MTQTKLTDIAQETDTCDLPDWPDPGDMSEYTPSPTPLDPDSVEVPAPDPAEDYTSRASKTIDEEELREAVQRLNDNAGPVPVTPLHQAIGDLPRWLDDSDKPETNGSGPDRCDSCDSLQPWLHPLEQGRELALSGDDGNPAYTPCQPGKYNIESCTCCGCPSCGARSIYARKQATPTYRCRNPDCKAEFSHPVELPLDVDEVRRNLYWECGTCGGAVLAPFEGVPEDMI